MSRVLLVEDDADCRDLLEEFLRMKGHEPASVATGQAAIGSFQDIEPDMVLLDISLSGSHFDGFETLRRLRELSKRRIPIVAVSAHASQEARARGLEHGFDDYLTKPFEIDAFTEILNRFLSEKESR